MAEHYIFIFNRVYRTAIIANSAHVGSSLKRKGLCQNDSFDTTPVSYIRICKMQGAEGGGAGSLLA